LIQVEGQPGVQPGTHIVVPPQGAGVGGIADGQTFTISNGTTSVTFEFDNNSSTTPGNQAILFTPTTTVNQFADSIVAAIELTPLNLSPVNLGSGVIDLNDTASHTTDVRSSALTTFGVPGGAIPVRFIPDASFDGNDMALEIITTVLGSPLSNIRFIRRGGTQFEVEGATAISGLPNFFLQSIRDLAENDLRANQPNGDTLFTILMPGAQLDFGDAGAPYQTVLADNGARHAIIDPPLVLGTGVTADADGQPDAAAATDSDDGVDIASPLNVNTNTPLYVTVSGPGFLNTWIDYNADGDWTDPGEQVIKEQEFLEAGTYELTVGTPFFAPLGTTTARFRYSTQRDLAHTGVARDGEVEDYTIDIVPGDPPVAADDNVSTDEDTILNLTAPGLLANDSDPNGDPIQIFRPGVVASQLGAQIETFADGSFTYDPTTIPAIQSLAPGDTLTDTFTYRAQDAVLPSDPATVSVTVFGANDDPVAQDDAYTTDEDTLLQVSPFGVLANDSDIDNGDQVSVQAGTITSTLGATVVLQANGGFTYDPRGIFDYLSATSSVVDTFTYTAEDTHGGTDTAVVSITVQGRNDDPVAADDSYNDPADRPNEDAVYTVSAAAGLLANDTDVDGDTLSIDQAASDAMSAEGAVITYQSDGGFSYDPTGASSLQAIPLGGTKTDTFNYTVTDPYGGTDQASVTLTVDGRNDNPTGQDDLYTGVLQDRVLVVNQASLGLLANDSDIDQGDTISVSRFDAVSTKGATVSVLSDGTFVYDPTQSATLAAVPEGQKTTDTFTYDVADQHGAIDTVTVSVEVTGVNSPPITQDDLYSTNEDSTVSATQSVLANDSDPEGDPVLFVDGDATSAQGAAVTWQTNGFFTYDPRSAAALQALNSGQQLDDIVYYRAKDPQGNTSTGKVIVTVTGINDAPVAADDAFDARPNQTTNLDVLGNDSDIDGTLDAASVQILSGPSHGTVAILADGSIDYTPTAGYSGPDAFTYQVSDNGTPVLSDAADVTINVNEPPVAVDDSVTAYNNGATLIDILSNDADSDGVLVPSSVTITQDPTHGQLTVRSDGKVVYRPTLGYVGADEFRYTVEDDDGAASNEAIVSIDVINNPFPWQNPFNPFDVNDDGFVSPIDVLLLINELSFVGPRALPVPPTPPEVPPPYLDPTGDNFLTTSDALAVVQYLNQLGGGEGESDRSSRSRVDWRSFAGDRRTAGEGESVPIVRRGSAPTIREAPLTGAPDDRVLHDLRGVLAGADWRKESLEDTLNDIVDHIDWFDDGLGGEEETG